MTTPAPLKPNVIYKQGFIPKTQCAALEEWILNKVPFFRPEYHKAQYDQDRSTPCWTSVAFPYRHGGVPECLDRLARCIESHLGLPENHFDAYLIRLYQDGDDHIAPHSDKREFLNEDMTIASVSLGPAKRTFIMHQIVHAYKDRTKVHPDVTYPWTLGRGDLLVMCGTETQTKFEHAVPRESKTRGYRINLNFRSMKDKDAGMDSYLRYCTNGNWEEAERKRRLNPNAPLTDLDVFGPHKLGRDVVPKVTLRNFFTPVKQVTEDPAPAEDESEGELAVLESRNKVGCIN